MRRREFKIKDFPNVRFSAGTENRDQLKACYIELSSTFQTEDNFKHLMNKTVYDIKQSVYGSINKEIFMEKFLTTTNIPNDYYLTGKGFTKIEFTFYIRKKIELSELGQELNNMCDKIYQTSFVNPKDMKFNKKFITKRDYAKK